MTTCETSATLLQIVGILLAGGSLAREAWHWREKPQPVPEYKSPDDPFAVPLGIRPPDVPSAEARAQRARDMSSMGGRPGGSPVGNPEVAGSLSYTNSVAYELGRRISEHWRSHESSFKHLYDANRDLFNERVSQHQAMRTRVGIEGVGLLVALVGTAMSLWCG